MNLPAVLSLPVMHANDSTAGFKWPIRVERPIAAPAQEVWNAISQPLNLELCHPYCASNPVQIWPGPNSHDEVHYLSGWVYERHFHEWIDGVGYDLEIGRSGGSKSLVSWRIIPVEAHNCALRITVCPHALQNLHSVIRWIPHVFWLYPQLRKYLNSVVKGVEWYVIRHEPVPRNAFGTHPWFSARESAYN
jgi:hypothetical protein